MQPYLNPTRWNMEDLIFFWRWKTTLFFLQAKPSSINTVLCAVVKFCKNYKKSTKPLLRPWISCRNLFKMEDLKFVFNWRRPNILVNWKLQFLFKSFALPPFFTLHPSISSLTLQQRLEFDIEETFPVAVYFKIYLNSSSLCSPAVLLHSTSWRGFASSSSPTNFTTKFC